MRIASARGITAVLPAGNIVHMPSRTQRNNASVYIALLRGINVGGKNKLPMADLTTIVEELGGVDVQTYIQSGNIVLRATKTAAQRLPKLLAHAIQQSFNITVPVIVRTETEWRAVVKANPFLKAGCDERSLHVAFLADVPEKRAAAALDQNRSPGDSFHLRGREVYLHLPNGVARTKITNQYLDATLKTTSTLRNWRTVLKLLYMAETVQ